ncbi:MAG: GtrA family protein [Alphaproteobacteria bacterium]|nr:GtrA family protein [Alphaproteobacteria bacterium]
MMVIARQFISWCGVGVINTIVGLLVIVALSAGLGWHYMLANAGGYVCGVALSFVLNRRFTFRDTAPMRAQIKPFLVVFVVAYGVQLVALYAMVGLWHWPELLAQAVAIGIYTVVGFFGSRLFVFSSLSKN